jgi:hypothetical protein
MRSLATVHVIVVPQPARAVVVIAARVASGETTVEEATAALEAVGVALGKVASGAMTGRRDERAGASRTIASVNGNRA